MGRISIFAHSSLLKYNAGKYFQNVLGFLLRDFFKAICHPFVFLIFKKSKKKSEKMMLFVALCVDERRTRLLPLFLQSLQSPVSSLREAVVPRESFTCLEL